MKGLPKRTSGSFAKLSSTEVRKVPRPSDDPSFPLTPGALRKAILEKAEIGLDQLADAIRRAFATNLKLLEAEKTVITTCEGQVLKFNVPDNAARQRAAESLYDIGGVVPKTDPQQSAGPMVVLQLPNYYDPAFVQAAKVIDVHQTPDTESVTNS
jgi:hypothetical protein